MNAMGKFTCALICAVVALCADSATLNVAVSPYADFALSVGGVPVRNHAKVAPNAVVTVTATPFEGYEYTAAPEGWTLADGRLVRDFTAAVDPLAITIPSPTASSAAVDPVKYPFAKQDLKMLTIGNSWTIGPCSGAMNFTIGATALGYRVKHLGLFKENASFSMHWSNIDVVDYYTSVYTMNTTAVPYPFTKEGQKTGLSLRGLINAEDWDIVTLFDASENSRAPWNSYVWSCFSNLVETVHALKPNAKIFLMQTWACGRYYVSYKDADGLPSFDLRDNNYDALIANYNNALHYFDTKYPGLVSRILPSGYALQLYTYEKPLKTWGEGLQITTAPDYGKHLATGGSTIETLTWLKTIYGKVVPRESMPTDYANSFAGSGTDPDLGYYCVLKACAADESGYADYGRGEVAFEFPVVFKSWDGSVIETQMVTNRASAVVPNISGIEMGEGYVFAGWRQYASDPFADNSRTLTAAQINAAKVYDSIQYTIKRKLVGEVDSRRDWTGLGDGYSWTDAANWDPEVVPDANSDVYIPKPATAEAVRTIVTYSGISINSLTVGDGDGLGKAVLKFAINDCTVTNRVAGSVTVRDRGTITCQYNYNGDTRKYQQFIWNYRVVMEVGGNFDIQSGGLVDVSKNGCALSFMVYAAGTMADDGMCGYAYASGVTGRSGSHGGIGGKGTTSASDYPCYGSIRRPFALGDGGDKNYDNVNNLGGGSVHLIVTNGTLTVNGDILATGGNGSYGNSAAGGSVWLEARSFNGSGSVDVRGGSVGAASSTCGGSGRIAIYTRAERPAEFSVAGGPLRLLAGARAAKNGSETANNRHGCGTIYIETAAHNPGQGVLYIDGGDVGTYAKEYAAQVSSLVEENNDENAVFEAIVVQNKGRLYLTPGTKLYTRELQVVKSSDSDTKTTCTDSATDPTLGTVEIVSTHHFGAWVTNTFANCTNAGECVRTCTDDGCGLAETNAIAALGHDWSAWVTNPAPTKVSTGLRTRTCQRPNCGEKEAEVVPQLPEDPDPPTPPPPTPPPGPTPGPGGDPTPYPIAAGDGWSKVVDNAVVVAFTNVNASSLTFTVPKGVTSIDYLLVAGGGGGGTSSGKSGAGGGGAGGVVLVDGFAVTAGTSLSVTVGAGGAGGYSSDTTRTGQGYEGGNSLLGDAVAHGGGAGGGLNDKWAGVRYYGTKGGSGGGAAYYKGYTGGACYEGEGHKGGDVGSAYHYRGGGGGGAGGAGANGDAGLAGGAGRSIDITGESLVYAEGGHGSYRDNWAARSTIGSGGCGCYNVDGRKGNNGIVIIRYATRPPCTLLIIR